MNVAGIIVGGIGLVAGLVSCLFGYRLRKLGITLLGVIIGGTVGYTVLAEYMTGFAPYLVAALIAAGVGAIFYFLYNVGIFTLCGGSAALVAGLVAAALEAPGWATLAVVLAGFVLVGALSMKFLRPVVIATTAFSGASSIVGIATAALPNVDFGVWSLAATLVLMAVGIVFQWHNTAAAAK